MAIPKTTTVRSKSEFPRNPVSKDSEVYHLPYQPRSRYRKLRIAWSAVCGVVCLLLIVLWVRSYWWADFVNIDAPSPWAVQLLSVRGHTTTSIFEPEQSWNWIKINSGLIQAS